MAYGYKRYDGRGTWGHSGTALLTCLQRQCLQHQQRCTVFAASAALARMGLTPSYVTCLAQADQGLSSECHACMVLNSYRLCHRRCSAASLLQVCTLGCDWGRRCCGGWLHAVPATLNPVALFRVRNTMLFLNLQLLHPG